MMQWLRGRRGIAAILIVILTGGWGLTFGEEIGGQTEDRGNGEPFFKCILEDQAAIWTAPVRWRGQDWLLAGGVAVLTGLLIANDEAIFSGIKDYKENNPWVGNVSPVFSQLGEGWVPLASAGLFYLGGTVFKNPRSRETARLLLMTFLHCGIVVQAIKHVTGRQRPSYEDGIDRWHWLEGFFKQFYEDRSKYNSFPSGHTIVAWGTATVIAERYKESAIVPVLCYSLATLAGLARITEEAHWLSDVFVGAVLGYAIGRFVVRKRSSKWQVTPVASPNRVGLTLSYRLE